MVFEEDILFGEFMELQKLNSVHFGPGVYSSKEFGVIQKGGMRYRFDWNWLMPVAIKIMVTFRFTIDKPLNETMTITEELELYNLSGQVGYALSGKAGVRRPDIEVNIDLVYAACLKCLRYYKTLQK